MNITQKLLTKNEWSRPGAKLNTVKAVVLHWTAGPKDTPEGVYKWFEQRKKGKTGYGSAHYCVGMDGATMQFLPDEEIAYHVGSKTYTKRGLEISKYPNDSTIGIEMCPINIEGEFTEDTWNNTVKLTALLLSTYNLDIKDIVTHKNIVGWKDCPRWFSTFPEQLEKFKNEVRKEIRNKMYGSVNVQSKLNVRDSPKGKKIGTLSNRDIVMLRGIKNGWLEISYRTGTGWVFGKYIK